ncbi:MAG TPA: methylenetetrahydrofolate reductase, partial [Gammaproteobacteria bacterium]|nr:methylenetetrahydrofolate reductase [Gammaproteobacteria bacterium]
MNEFAETLPREPESALRLSFEFFPPKTPAMDARLWDTVERLTPFRPDFVSVTYGAGGSTRDRTHATVERIRRDTPLEPAAHLTCVGATRGEIDEVVDRYVTTGASRSPMMPPARWPDEPGQASGRQPPARLLRVLSAEDRADGGD